MMDFPSQYPSTSYDNNLFNANNSLGGQYGGFEDRERRRDRDFRGERDINRGYRDRRDDSRNEDVYRLEKERDDFLRNREKNRDNFERDRGRSSSGMDYSREGVSREEDLPRDNRERDRSRERQYSDSYRGRDDRNESRAGRSSDYERERMREPQTPTILLRGLPQHAEEKDIRAELIGSEAIAKDVRLVKKRETGESRGFAFVEFHNIADARRWMEEKQGRLRLLDRYDISLHYSTPTNRDNRQSLTEKTDWNCTKCGVHNFKRRDYCYKCNITREESERIIKSQEGADQVGTNPCNTLIFQGLDALTTEDVVRSALERVTALPVKHVYVVRDQLTKVSKGFSLIEMHSVQQSSQLLETLGMLSPAFEIDGKQVIMSFSKNTFNTAKMQLDSVYGPIGSQHHTNPDYYNRSHFDTTTQTNSTNAAAAVAQAALLRAQAKFGQKSNKGQTDSEVKQWDPSSRTEEHTQYPVPDVSTYLYDESSGYYYDPQTGLYYDANTQYYYNSQTGKFMYWNGEKATYLPAATDEQKMEDAKKDQEAEKEKKEKDKVAKKIAKDMERWAKSQNSSKAKKEAFRQNQIEAQKTAKEAKISDIGFQMLVSNKSDDRALMPPPPGSPVKLRVAKQEPEPAPPSGLVPSYGDEDSEEETEEDGGFDIRVEEAKLTDWSKLACLLCKRQFPSREVLLKHQQQSALHKENLQTLRGQKMMEMVSKQSQPQYRDRAKERRQKYGAPEPPQSKNKASRFNAPSINYEQPQHTKDGIGSENVGNRLLSKMGWNEGQGLGKRGQGIVNPIQAKVRNQSAGLGARGSTHGIGSYEDRDAIKRAVQARYNELE